MGDAASECQRNAGAYMSQRELGKACLKQAIPREGRSSSMLCPARITKRRSQPSRQAELSPHRSSLQVSTLLQ